MSQSNRPFHEQRDRDALTVKFFELRDSATFIPIFAFRTRSPNKLEHYLLRRAGFSLDSELVILGRLDAHANSRDCAYDPHAWGGRSFPVAHHYIQENFDSLVSGEVIDVEFILGETAIKKESEQCLTF